MSKRVLLSRVETSEALGTSISNVRKMEKRGLLTNRPDSSGRARYSRYAVEQLARERGVKPARRTRGEVDAEVFRMLREGKAPHEIVEALKISMARFRELYAVFKGGTKAVDESIVAEEEGLSLALHEQQMAEMEEAFQQRREKDAVTDEQQAQDLAGIEEALRERFGDLWGEDKK